MAYRAPEMPEIKGPGLKEAGWMALIKLLESGFQKTEEEGQQWLTDITTTDNLVQSQGYSSEYMNELDALIDETIEQGDRYYDVTGDEKYNIAGINLKHTVNNRKALINKFEDSAIRTGSYMDWANPNTVFNIDRFMEDVEGEEARQFKTGNAFLEELQAWNNELAGAPISWDFTVDVSSDTLANFLNVWQRIATNKDLDEDLRQKFAPLTVLNQGVNAARNRLQGFLDMGITFNEHGNMNTINMTNPGMPGYMGNIKTEFDIEYTDEYGNPAVKTVPLVDLAQEAWDTYRDYSNLSYDMTQQTITPTVSRLTQSEDGQTLYRTPGLSSPIGIVTSNSVMEAMSRGVEEFNQYTDTMRTELIEKVNSHDSKIMSYYQFTDKIATQIESIDQWEKKNNMDWAGMTDAMAAKLKESMGQTLNQQDREDLMNVFGYNAEEVVANSNNKGYLESLKRIINQKIIREDDSLIEARRNALIWGAADLLDVPSDLIGGIAEFGEGEGKSTFVTPKQTEEAENIEWEQASTSLSDVSNSLGEEEYLKLLQNIVGIGSSEKDSYSPNKLGRLRDEIYAPMPALDAEGIKAVSNSVVHIYKMMT